MVHIKLYVTHLAIKALCAVTSALEDMFDMFIHIAQSKYGDLKIIKII